MISRYEHPRDDLRLQVEAGTVGEDRETDCVQGAKPFAAIPAFGTDQRQLNPLLPQRLAHLVHHLAPGERTPAFVVDTEYVSLVTWYLRLSDPGESGLAPIPFS
jgi:hypothetical protein